MTEAEFRLSQLKEVQEQEKKEKKANLLSVKTANEWIEYAKSLPNPVMLCGSLICQNEVVIAFADTGIGKSVFGCQVGINIAKGSQTEGGLENQGGPKKVLYLDCELSVKQFQKRYSEDFKNNLFFPDNFLRAEIDISSDVPDDVDAEQYLIDSVIQVIEAEKIEFLIVDNLTYLSKENEKSKDALPLMKKLVEIKRKYKLTMLILAHTPKRDLSVPITNNHLQGSRMLMNFCDSAFAIGRSANDNKLRYIKQTKVRSMEEEYHSENVLTYEMSKEVNYLKFDFICFSPESEHLQKSSDNDKEQAEDEAFRLKEEGKSIREIAELLKVSKSTVGRWLKEYNQPSQVSQVSQVSHTPGQWDSGTDVGQQAETHF